MTLITATGVFEILHPGHLLYLEESKKLGDKLVVIVASDKTVRERKGHKFVPEQQRLEVVKSLRIVDEAVLGDEEDWMNTVRKIQPDIITIGFDQEIDIADLEKQVADNGLKTKFVRIEKHWQGDLNSSKKIKNMGK